MADCKGLETYSWRSAEFSGNVPYLNACIELCTPDTEVRSEGVGDRALLYSLGWPFTYFVV